MRMSRRTGACFDEYLAEDFVAHNPPLPGITLDGEGMKQASEMFRLASPGRHEIRMQVAEDDLVVSHILGRGVRVGELLESPAIENPGRDGRYAPRTRPTHFPFPTVCGEYRRGHAMGSRLRTR